MDAERIKLLALDYDPSVKLKPKQLEALDSLASGTDTIVSVPVGYGKSLIYHLLPKVLGESVASSVVIVLSPLNIIQKDQMFALSKHGILGCRLDMNTNVCQTTDPLQTKVNISNVVIGRYSIVLAHPEAFLNTEKGRELQKKRKFLK